MDRLLRIHEVAEMTGMPVETWRTWVARKQGPQPARLGRRLVWRESQIESWIDEQFELAATTGTK